MIRLSNKNGSSMAAPFKSLINSCNPRIIKIPAAMSRFPQTKVLGNKMSNAAIIVIAPLTMIAVFEKFHLLNINSISGLPDSIAQPCFNPINTATSIKMELNILIVIVCWFIRKGKQPKLLAFSFHRMC